MQGSNWHIVKNQPTWQEQTTGNSVLSGLFFKTRKVWDTTLWDASKRLEASRVTLTGMLLHISEEKETIMIEIIENSKISDATEHVHM